MSVRDGKDGLGWWGWGWAGGGVPRGRDSGDAPSRHTHWLRMGAYAAEPSCGAPSGCPASGVTTGGGPRRRGASRLPPPPPLLPLPLPRAAAAAAAAVAAAVSPARSAVVTREGGGVWRLPVAPRLPVPCDRRNRLGGAGSRWSGAGRAAPPRPATTLPPPCHPPPPTAPSPPPLHPRQKAAAPSVGGARGEGAPAGHSRGTREPLLGVGGPCSDRSALLLFKHLKWGLGARAQAEKHETAREIRRGGRVANGRGRRRCIERRNYLTF